MTTDPDGVVKVAGKEVAKVEQGKKTRGMAALYIVSLVRKVKKPKRSMSEEKLIVLSVEET